MKKYFLYFLFCLLLHFPYVSFGDEYCFVLPTGNPYKETSFESDVEMGVRLRFGDSVEIVDTLSRGDTVWYEAMKDGSRFYLPEPFVVRIRACTHYDDAGNLLIGYEVVDKKNAIPLLYRPNDLIKLPQYYAAEGYEDRELLLRREAEGAFALMMDEASNDGVSIRVISAFRDSQYQSYLYKRAIDRYGLNQSAVAKPGHSEHQLGTTCDLTTDEVGYRLTRDFESTLAFIWMKEHAHRYGISHSFPKYKERITGYIYEPWHFRYWGKERWRNYIERMGLFFTR